MRNKDLVLHELRRRWFQKHEYKLLNRLTEIKKDAESANPAPGVKDKTGKSVVSVPLLGEENNGKQQEGIVLL